MAKQSRREWTERKWTVVISAFPYFLSILMAAGAIYAPSYETLADLILGAFLMIMSLFFFAIGTWQVFDTITRTSIIFEDEGIWATRKLGRRTTKRFIPYDEIQAAILGPRTLTIEYRPKRKKGLKHENLVDEEVTESLLLELSAKGVKLEFD